MIIRWSLDEKKRILLEIAEVITKFGPLKIENGAFVDHV